MENTFTHEDLFIRHLYGETNLDEDFLIAHLLESDWNAKEKFDELEQTVGFLNSFKPQSPSRTSLNIILNYSKHMREPEVTY